MLIKDTPFSWFLFDQAKSNPRYKQVDVNEQIGLVNAYLDALYLPLSTGEDIDDWLDMSDWGSCFILIALAIRLQNKLFFQNCNHDGC